MIRATELRIGNWINTIRGVKQVASLKVQKVIDGEYITIGYQDGDYSISTLLQDHCEGIPLTPEVLEKCGFKKEIWNNGGLELKISIDNWDIKYTLWANGNISFGIVADGGYDDSGEFDILEKCKHLHQLQNLYFALAGTELEYTL